MGQGGAAQARVCVDGSRQRRSSGQRAAAAAAHLLVGHRCVPKLAHEVCDNGHQSRVQARERAGVHAAAAGLLGGRLPDLLVWCRGGGSTGGCARCRRRDCVMHSQLAQSAAAHEQRCRSAASQVATAAACCCLRARAFAPVAAPPPAPPAAAAAVRLPPLQRQTPAAAAARCSRPAQAARAAAREPQGRV